MAIGEVIKCIVCGKEFTKKSPQQKYCSLKCQYKFWNKSKNRKLAPKGLQKKICLVCKKEYTGKSYSKYCSYECQQKADHSPILAKQCIYCGRVFYPKMPWQKVCHLKKCSDFLNSYRANLNIYIKKGRTDKVQEWKDKLFKYPKFRLQKIDKTFRWVAQLKTGRDFTNGKMFKTREKTIKDFNDYFINGKSGN